MFSSEIYEVEDCIFYDPLTTDHSKWVITGSMSTNEHNSNGWKFGNGSGLVWIDITNYAHDGNIAIEYTPTEAYSGSNGTYAPIMIYFEKDSNNRAYATQRNTSVQVNSSNVISHNVQLGSEYRVEYTGTTVKYLYGDSTLGTGTHSLGNTGITPRLATGANSRYCRIKDFKIKPL